MTFDSNIAARIQVRHDSQGLCSCSSISYRTRMGLEFDEEFVLVNDLDPEIRAEAARLCQHYGLAGEALIEVHVAQMLAREREIEEARARSHDRHDR